MHTRSPVATIPGVDTLRQHTATCSSIHRQYGLCLTAGWGAGLLHIAAGLDCVKSTFFILLWVKYKNRREEILSNHHSSNSLRWVQVPGS